MGEPKLSHLLLLVLGAPPLFAQVDYRSAQSPVKNQGARGTCAAHAIAAAMETFPGIPDDLSEQFLYGLQKKVDVEGTQILAKFGVQSKIVEGTFLLAYLDWFRIYGAPHERYLPYEGGQLVIKDKNVPEDLKRLVELTHVTPENIERLGDAWGKYGIAKVTGVQGAEAANVDMIKKWLDAGALAVPAGYRLYGPEWSRHMRIKVAADAKEPFFTPEEMEEFQDKVMGWLPYKKAKLQAAIDKKDFTTEVAAGDIPRRDLDRKPGAEQRYGGHSMTIVGYTDKAFIVKNSWGEEWGNRGYCFISFDYHRLYCWHCARIESVKTRIPALSPFEKTKRIRESEYRMRLQPVTDQRGERWRISVLAMDSRDPMLEAIDYRLETKGASGDWHKAGQWTVVKKGELGAFDYDPGFLLELSPQQVASLTQNASELRWVVGFGHFPLGDRAKIEEAEFLATKTFGNLPSHPKAAVELAPR